MLWHVDKIHNNHGSYPQITQAAQLLRDNEVVAFPTETVYGLGANAASDEAVSKIFAAKGRPGDNPLIVHISDSAQLHSLVVDIPDKAYELMSAFWPGPLTIIFRLREGSVSRHVTAGLNTIAVRMPDHPVALALIEESGLPIAAPSANKSGRPSPTAAAHVLADLSGEIAGVVDGGETGVGVESTVLDCTGDIPVVLRPGGISREDIESIVGEIAVDPALAGSGEVPKSPGMKYTHYAPAAPLFLADGPQEWIQQQIDEKRQDGLKVGVLATEESAEAYKADVVIPCGRRADLTTVAHSLYSSLRYFDAEKADLIFAEVFPVEGAGAAIMNRLEKAAGHRWLREKQ